MWQRPHLAHTPTGISSPLIIPALLLILGSIPIAAAEQPLDSIEVLNPAVRTMLNFEEFRSMTGEGNNTAHPEWGKAGMPLIRQMMPCAYEDGVQEPPHTGLPGPREISNAVVASPEERLNAAGASGFIWQWGQFIDHDIALTFPAAPAEPMPIPVPVGDPFFDPAGTGTQVIPFARSFYTMVNGVREQIGEITAFIDASNVYGSDDERILVLREMDGSGKMRMTEGRFLPYNTEGLRNEPDSTDPSFFLAGDIRANEQLGLISMHTLFLREHNYQVTRMRREKGKKLSGEEAFQMARAVVVAELQAITYREFLPALLGPDALEPYTGYRVDVHPGIENSFAGAIYRVGHTLITPELLRLKRNGRPIDDGNIALRDAFFVPAELVSGHGIEPILRGLAANQAMEIDPFIVDELRNFLFGPPGAGGFDLASLNIQRGRDHGLPRYNAAREMVGLSRKNDFAEVSSDVSVQERLAGVYASVDDIDLWVGALSEDHRPGAMVGELLFTVIRDQFQRLRDGDRFYYENYLTPDMVAYVNAQTLAAVIRRNTRIRNEISDNVFLVSPDLLAQTPEYLGSTQPEIPRIVVGPPFPNPARGGVRIQLSVTSGPEVGDVAIYDVRGRLVRSLPFGFGRDQVLYWDRLDGRGRRAPSGAYFIQVKPPGANAITRKVLLVD